MIMSDFISYDGLLGFILATTLISFFIILMYVLVSVGIDALSGGDGTDIKKEKEINKLILLASTIFIVGFGLMFLISVMTETSEENIIKNKYELVQLSDKSKVYYKHIRMV